MKLVSINIVNWNSIKYIDACIASIKSQSYKNIEINIIDNNSSDGSNKLVKKKYPEINFIQNKKNEGFSKAHNALIKISKGDYILPLNFDIILEPDFVKELVKAMESSPNIGIVSGKLYKLIDGKKTNMIDSTGITMKAMFPADRGENLPDNGQFSKQEFVFGASGAAPLYRRRMLEDVNLAKEYFDEDFWIYVEDVDLCWRAQLRGWKAVYTPKSIAYHYRGITRKDDKSTKKDYLTRGYKNRYWTIIKNMPLSLIFKNIHLILLIELNFYRGHFLAGNFYMFKIPFETLNGISKIIMKRRNIQKNKKINAEYIEGFFFKNVWKTMIKKIKGLENE